MSQHLQKMIKEKLDGLERFLDELKDVEPEDPMFFLVVYAEGMRDALMATFQSGE